MPDIGLLIEANYKIKVAEAERAIRVAEAEVYRLRARESIFKAWLFEIQVAMEERLLQISDTLIGHERAEMECIAEHQILPDTFRSSVIAG